MWLDVQKWQCAAPTLQRPIILLLQASLDNDAVDIASFQSALVQQLGLVGPVQIQCDGTLAVAKLLQPCLEATQPYQQ